MAYAAANGVRLNYEAHGEGDAVLLLGTTWMVLQAWLDEVTPALVAAGHRVIVCDSRGVGRSEAPSAPYSIAEMSEDVQGLIEHLGASPCAVAGVSLGGFVVEELVWRRPDLVTAAALIASARPASAYGRLLGEAHAEAAALDVDLPQSLSAVELLGELLTPSQLRDDALVRAAYGRLSSSVRWRNPGRHGQLTAALDGLMDPDVARRWPGIIRPVLVVGFAGDTVFPLESAQAMAAALPAGELVVLEGAGHGGPLTHATELGRALAGFFSRTRAPRSRPGRVDPATVV